MSERMKEGKKAKHKHRFSIANDNTRIRSSTNSSRAVRKHRLNIYIIERQTPHTDLSRVLFAVAGNFEDHSTEYGI